MLGILIRKKVSNEKLANVFINGIYSTTQNGFPTVAEFINEDPSFVRKPGIDANDHHEFTLILFIGNLALLENAFTSEQSAELETLILRKLATAYQMEIGPFREMVKEYQYTMTRLNHPSKNVIYGMSKMLFDKYALYSFQDAYFKRMQVANPLFLKRMDEVIENFVWDWDMFFKKYKLNS